MVSTGMGKQCIGGQLELSVLNLITIATVCHLLVIFC